MILTPYIEGVTAPDGIEWLEDGTGRALLDISETDDIRWTHVGWGEQIVIHDRTSCESFVIWRSDRGAGCQCAATAVWVPR